MHVIIHQEDLYYLKSFFNTLSFTETNGTVTGYASLLAVPLPAWWNMSIKICCSALESLGSSHTIGKVWVQHFLKMKASVLLE